MTDNAFADQANKEQPQYVANEDGTVTVGDRTMSQEDLVNSWVNAQNHIKTLEGENAGFREELTKAQTLDNVLNELRQKDATTAEQTASEQTAPEVKSLSEEDVFSLMDKRDTEKKTEANKTEAFTMAKEALGEGYVDKLTAKANDLGISPDDAMDLAGRSPTAFKQMFLSDVTPPTPPVDTSGDINAGAIIPKTEKPSARVSVGASTSDLVNAWNAAAPQIED